MKDTAKASFNLVVSHKVTEPQYDPETNTLAVPPELERYAIEEQYTPGFLNRLRALHNFYLLLNDDGGINHET